MQEALDPLGDDLPPLKIGCTHTDCATGLHCFQQKRRSESGRAGPCRDCGAELVEWERVHRRNPADIQYLLASMAKEYIRHEYWCRLYDARAIYLARLMGRRKLQEAVPKRLKSIIGRPADAFDGRRTPYEGDAIAYAQHATATCCRRCVEEWHGIPPDRELTSRELDYLTLLVRHYLAKRPVPGLTEEGEKPKRLREQLGLPPIRHKQKRTEEAVTA